MPLITDKLPETWDELEETVAAILRECGMKAERSVSLQLPRGSVEVDVLAEESVHNVVQRIICECKNWRANIPKEVVHAFRTVIQETGAHRGYIISKMGFQAGAKEASKATNIELVTFAEFQNIYFEKWIKTRIWQLEKETENFSTYYEPLGKPGFSQLRTNEERAAYDEVWHKYLFAGLMLIPFSPYMRMVGDYPFPKLPFDISELEKQNIIVPDDIRCAAGYREFFIILTGYTQDGLKQLRAVNPITRDKAPEEVERDD